MMIVKRCCFEDTRPSSGNGGAYDSELMMIATISVDKRTSSFRKAQKRFGNAEQGTRRE
jgi:hypothetical protein